jgi:hypothetical protein
LAVGEDPASAVFGLAGFDVGDGKAIQTSFKNIIILYPKQIIKHQSLTVTLSPSAEYYYNSNQCIFP